VSLPRNLPERGALRYLHGVAPAWSADAGSRHLGHLEPATPSGCSLAPPPRP